MLGSGVVVVDQHIDIDQASQNESFTEVRSKRQERETKKKDKEKEKKEKEKVKEQRPKKREKEKEKEKEKAKEKVCLRALIPLRFTRIFFFDLHFSRNARQVRRMPPRRRRSQHPLRLFSHLVLRCCISDSISFFFRSPLF
jgi:hypothetical protein